MVTLFLRQGETGKQVLLSFPATTPAEKEGVASTLESLKSISKTVTIQGAASEVMNLGLYLSGVDLAAEGETVVHDIHHIDRGYEDYVGKLHAIGANVERKTL